MLSLCYLPTSNKLTCVVIKARDLPRKDFSGTSGSLLLLTTAVVVMMEVVQTRT